MKKIIKTGAVDQTLDIFIQDSTSTTGAGKTGLVYNSAGLKCYYRKGATGSATALTLATQTVGGAHSDGGFVEIDATNMPGMYRLDLSDTIVASAGSVSLMLSGATGMAPLPIELQVASTDLEGGVMPTTTTLTNAPSDSSGVTTLLTRVPGAISLSAGAVTVGTNNDKTGYSIATGGIGTGDIDSTALNEIADAILDRVMSAGTDSGGDNTTSRTVRQALRTLRNRVNNAAGTLTVYKEDDTTTSWTAATTQTAGDPISQINPT